MEVIELIPSLYQVMYSTPELKSFLTDSLDIADMGNRISSRFGPGMSTKDLDIESVKFIVNLLFIYDINHQKRKYTFIIKLLEIFYKVSLESVNIAKAVTIHEYMLHHKVKMQLLESCNKNNQKACDDLQSQMNSKLKTPHAKNTSEDSDEFFEAKGDAEDIVEDANGHVTFTHDAVESIDNPPLWREHQVHQWIKYYLNNAEKTSNESNNTHVMIKFVAWYFESYNDTPRCLSKATDTMRIFLLKDSNKNSLMNGVISYFINYFKSDTHISNTHHDILLYLNTYKLDFRLQSIRGFFTNRDRRSNLISHIRVCIPIIRYLIKSSKSEVFKERMNSIIFQFQDLAANSRSHIEHAVASSARSIGNRIASVKSFANRFVRSVRSFFGKKGGHKSKKCRHYTRKYR